jgi:pyroglutamyl-peptidase
MTKKILVTGFSPFEGENINPTLEVINQVNNTKIAGATVITQALPVVYRKSFDVLRSCIREVEPEVIVALGQAGGRMEITPERVAVNMDDFRIQDNEGNQPQDQAIIADAPTAYWSTLPIKAMVSAMKLTGIPAQVSNTAGLFVCNHVFYLLMNYLTQEGNIRQGGFIHIPYLPEQVVQKPGQPSMSLETIVQGITTSLQVIADYDSIPY